MPLQLRMEAVSMPLLVRPDIIESAPLPLRLSSEPPDDCKVLLLMPLTLLRWLCKQLILLY
jgi:hypothetical protein